MSQDKSLADLISSADPALTVTEAELLHSRQRSLAFLGSDATQIAVGGSIHDFHRPPAKRNWGRFAGAGLVAAGLAACVVVAPGLVRAPLDMAAAPTVSEVTALPDPPSGPARDLFISADEVLVLQALPNTSPGSRDRSGPFAPTLGVEPVNVVQVLKGSRPVGAATLDVSAMPDPDMWTDTNVVAPRTYLAFFKKDDRGVSHLMKDQLAILEVLNLRSATLADPRLEKPVDVGTDLVSRISVGPTGDVPVTTYSAQASPGRDVLLEQRKNADGTVSGTIHGHISGAQACFTFETSTEQVFLRWPAGYTATTRLLPQSPEGEFRINGTSAGNKAVVLNDWGLVYTYDGETRPLIMGARTGERADCNGQNLPVFDISPGQQGATPFRNSRGPATS